MNRKSKVVLVAGVTLRGVLRDRILQAILGVAGLLLLLVPVLSQFSMRQVRELSITLSLSFSSFVLLVLGLLLGTTTLWRDIERRYTAAVLGLPLTRNSYLLGRFFGLALFVFLCGLVLAAAGCLVISFHAGQMSSGLSLCWLNIVAAFGGDVLKSLLVIALALMFSTVSTSLFLPVFGTLGIYFAGSASQEVMDYLSSPDGQSLPVVSRLLAKAFYYLLPNFEVFNFKVAAVYGLPLSVESVLYAVGYFSVYVALLLFFAVLLFNRREFA